MESMRGVDVAFQSSLRMAMSCPSAQQFFRGGGIVVHGKKGMFERFAKNEAAP
jgi:hypothetical protein